MVQCRDATPKRKKWLCEDTQYLYSYIVNSFHIRTVFLCSPVFFKTLFLFKKIPSGAAQSRYMFKVYSLVYYCSDNSSKQFLLKKKRNRNGKI